MPESRSVERPTTSATAMPIRPAVASTAGHGMNSPAHRDRIGADAEERDGRERNVVGRPGEQRPCGRQHGEVEKRDAERELIAARDLRHEGEQRDERGAEREAVEWLQRAGLPNSPVGRHSSTIRNSA